MMRLSIAIRRSPQVLALLLASSCGGGDGTTTGTPPVITPASITITPPAAPIVFGALGRTRTLAVVVMGSNGLPISSPTVTWTSANTGVATVSAAGVVTAVTNGTSNLTATTGSLVSTPVVITVAQVMASVVVSSASGVVDTLRTATRTRQYAAVAKDSTGNTVTGPTFTWSSNNTAVATVGAATGLVTAGSTFGTASITATSGAFNGSFLIGVAVYAATVAINPTTASIEVLESDDAKIPSDRMRPAPLKIDGRYFVAHRTATKPAHIPSHLGGSSDDPALHALHLPRLRWRPTGAGANPQCSSRHGARDCAVAESSDRHERAAVGAKRISDGSAEDAKRADASGRLGAHRLLENRFCDLRGEIAP